MAGIQTHTLPTGKFLTLSVNLLHKVFLEATRTEAKNLYREISEGKVVPLTRVRMEDGSEVRFEVGLDHSEYRGRLNFGAFRAGLTLLVANIADALREEKPVKTFHAEHDPNVVIFGISAVTVEEGEPSVLVLGADAGTGQPSVVLQLLYLERGQFDEQPGAGDAATPASGDAITDQAADGAVDEAAGKASDNG
jgi:hypothetical protein